MAPPPLSAEPLVRQLLGALLHGGAADRVALAAALREPVALAATPVSARDVAAALVRVLAAAPREPAAPLAAAAADALALELLVAALGAVATVFSTGGGRRWRLGMWHVRDCSTARAFSLRPVPGS